MTEQITLSLAGHARTVDVPDGTAAIIVAAFVAAYNYPANVQNDVGETVANPESPQDFTARQIREYIQNIVQHHIASQARAQADATADAQVKQLLGGVTVVPK